MKCLIFGGIVESLVAFRGNLIRDVISRGHEVVTCAESDGSESSRKAEDKLAEWGAKFIQVTIDRNGANPIQDIRTLLEIHKVLQNQRPEVMLCYTMKPVVFGGIAAYFAGVPRTVAMITGLGYAFSDGAAFRRKMVFAVLQSMLRLSLRNTSCTLFQNQDDLQLFLKMALVTEQGDVRVVPGSGIDLDEFTYSPPVNEPLTFILISRLLTEKGVRLFAAALEEIQQRHPVRGVLVGPFETSPGNISIEEVEKWCSKRTLDYIGAVSDVRPYLNESSVFVLPTWYREGIPRSILEAMAVGRPIITTDTPGCRDTVIQGKNGYLVRPRDLRSLVCAMENFASNRDLVRSMGLQSRAIAQSKFDVRKVNLQMLSALDL